MKFKFKSAISIILVMALMMNFCISAFAAESKIPADALVLTEENGDIYYFAMEDTETTRTSNLYDANGDVILTLVLDKEQGIIYNPDNGASASAPTSAVAPITPCSVLPAGEKDYEYEFCQLGDSYEKDTFITASEIANMVGATASSVAIAACLLTWSGFSAVSMKELMNKVEDIAEFIAGCFILQRFDFKVCFTILNYCAELYESDMSYPDGGFWFLGYLASPHDMYIIDIYT